MYSAKRKMLAMRAMKIATKRHRESSIGATAPADIPAGGIDFGPLGALIGPTGSEDRRMGSITPCWPTFSVDLPSFVVSGEVRVTDELVGGRDMMRDVWRVCDPCGFDFLA